MYEQPPTTSVVTRRLNKVPRLALLLVSYANLATSGCLVCLGSGVAFDWAIPGTSTYWTPVVMSIPLAITMFVVAFHLGAIEAAFADGRPLSLRGRRRPIDQYAVVSRNLRGTRVPISCVVFALSVIPMSIGMFVVANWFINVSTEAGRYAVFGFSIGILPMLIGWQGLTLHVALKKASGRNAA